MTAGRAAIISPITCGQRRTQRGAAALVVALVLVFGMGLVLVFANRGMLFEQRSSVNQYRATLAFELAEAGLEWAVARLNDDLFINSKCASSGAAVTVADPVTNSFRQRYLAPTVDTAGARFVIASPARTSCGIPNNGIDANGVPVGSANFKLCRGTTAKDIANSRLITISATGHPTISPTPPTSCP